MVEKFREYMQSKSPHFTGWEIKHSVDELDDFYTFPRYESFTYTKGKYEICISIDCQGWTPIMSIHEIDDKKGKRLIAGFERSKCDFRSEYDNPEIRNRFREVYNAEQEYDKKTKRFLDKNPKILDVYFEFLLASGILNKQ